MYQNERRYLFALRCKSLLSSFCTVRLSLSDSSIPDVTLIKRRMFPHSFQTTNLTALLVFFGWSATCSNMSAGYCLDSGIDPAVHQFNEKKVFIPHSFCSLTEFPDATNQRKEQKGCIPHDRLARPCVKNGKPCNLLGSFTSLLGRSYKVPNSRQVHS